MHFTRLRVTGFKSFVEPTELHIEPGLTGIVGPNGCGKSNVVEALRWVMGESAPRQMRSAEMDDVIFAGTDGRPPRNLAEVVLTLDNEDLTAPAAYNDSPEIDVTRRIERGSGSLYRVNGREVRARDVQTLFADTSTGSRSSAMVSQGRIGEIIGAKPTERRHVLEEAAGISGLHARRHEAELRLRAAETNLERLDDVLGALEESHRALKRQARQASRYRNISDHIRRADALLLHRRWTEAGAAMAEARRTLGLAEEAVGEATRLSAAAAARQAEAAADLPALRMAEAEAAARLQRLLVARDGLEAEERRIAEAARAADTQMARLGGDVERERGHLADAEEAIARLDAESARLAEAEAGESALLADLTARRADADGRAAEAETARALRLRALAEAESRRAELERRQGELAARRRRLEERREALLRERDACPALAGIEARLVEATERAVAASARAEAMRAALETAGRLRTDAESSEAEARGTFRAAEDAAGKARAETEALAALLEVGDPGLWPPLIDVVTVAPGYEVALGAAIGDDLLAPSDEAAPVHWRDLGPDPAAPALPAGARPLSEVVSAPPALARRLAQVGLVEDEAAGHALAPRIVQGQRLVARSGALWRWDGYRAAAGAPTNAANRLAQRNRLSALRATLAELAGRVDEARSAAEAAAAGLQRAIAEERQARAGLGDAERESSEAKAAEAEAGAELAAARARLGTAEAALAGLAAELDETAAAESAARTEHDTVEDLAPHRRAVEEAEARLAALRAEAEAVGTEHQRHLAAAEARRQRVTAIEAEAASWRERAADATRHLEDLERRLAEAAREREALALRPQALAEERAGLDRQIGDAEGARKEAADALGDAEARVEEAGRELRAAEARLADEREDRVRREAAVAQVEQTMQAIAERVREKLAATPEGTLAAAGLAEDVEIPEASVLETRLERLVRERDMMGPVNLRAESEAAELDERIRAMQAERADLLGAIARLRQGIAGLNREGRERLLTAFETVDRNFRQIFTRLFGGGNARLTLTEADDPFESGLEVMASPPGKRLQSMSLMSGGEQALAAVSLLFAVFLTNPAPVCVLDEVDAPLDDHNVDRFCDLLAEIAQATNTRFLLITHHRLTMARMDRLYGVTMPEHGVSQLVSVDLRTAEGLRETA